MFSLSFIWILFFLYLHSRSLVQIKSHAQKILKRSEGTNIYQKLEEHASRVHTLVTEAHQRLGLDPPPSIQHILANATVTTSTTTTNHDIRGSADVPSRISSNIDQVVETEVSNKRPRKGTEQILAASALCQLAGPEEEEVDKGTGTEQVAPICSNNDNFTNSNYNNTTTNCPPVVHASAEATAAAVAAVEALSGTSEAIEETVTAAVAVESGTVEVMDLLVDSETTATVNGEATFANEMFDTMVGANTHS